MEDTSKAYSRFNAKDNQQLKKTKANLQQLRKSKAGST